MKHIVLGGRANGLAVARGLRRVGFNSDVLDLDARAVCSVSRAVADFHHVEAADAAVTALLTRLCSGDGAVIYSTDDRWNAYMTRNRDAMQSVGALFPYGSVRAMDLVADKLALFEAAADVVDMPLTRAYTGEAPSSEWIVKPRFPFEGFVIRKKGAGNREVADAYASGDSFVMQHRIESPLRAHFSLCGLRTEKIVGALLYAKVLEYPHPGGTSTLSVIEQDEPLRTKLLEASERLLAYLDYRGIFEIEFIGCANSGRMFVVDVNLRFWLQHELGRLLGVDYVDIYRRMLLGESVPEPTAASGRVAWVHEGFPLSLIADWRSSFLALRELATRRWLLAHLRAGDFGPFRRFLGG